MPAAEVEMATSVLRSSSAQCIERKHDLASLTPKNGFVSAKPVERIAWQIGETQKATREVGARIGRIWRGAGCGPPPACQVVRCAIAVGRVSPSEQRVERLTRLCLSLAALPEFQQLIGLDVEQAGFHGGGAAQPPQQAGEAQHQLPLDSRFGIVVGNDGGLERLVVFRVCSLVRIKRGVVADPSTNRQQRVHNAPEWLDSAATMRGRAVRHPRGTTEMSGHVRRRAALYTALSASGGKPQQVFGAG